MLRSKKMKPVVKLAGHREKNAARELNQSRESHALQQKRLFDLQQHRQNYAKQIETKARKGMNAMEFARAQAFLAQIDTAIEQQRQHLVSSQEVVNVKTAGWKTDKMKQRVMQNVTTRIEKEESSLREKKDQREVDDIIGLRFFKQQKPLDP
ncbi:MAG TPA: flagellar export protein FliJ [Aeromonadales bacterium]|nr:flagellar export protein FliJ [Aeromonadales bacterium]